MNYEQFKEEFIDAVKEKLAEQGLDMNVSVNEVKKLNEPLTEHSTSCEQHPPGTISPCHRPPEKRFSLHTREQWHREVKWPTQSHTAGKRESPP